MCEGTHVSTVCMQLVCINRCVFSVSMKSHRLHNKNYLRLQETPSYILSAVPSSVFYSLFLSPLYKVNKTPHPLPLAADVRCCVFTVYERYAGEVRLTDFTGLDPSLSGCSDQK